MANLFEDLPSDLSKEVIEILAQSKNIRIERIVSFGQSSPDGFWYDQEQAEWVRRSDLRTDGLSLCPPQQ